MRNDRWKTNLGLALFLAAVGCCLSSARGDFFVGSGHDSDVLRYDNSGTFIGVFVYPGSGGLSGPRGLTFGPDGNLYVSSVDTGQVLRYNGTTGTFIDAFVPTGSGGLSEPEGLVFGNDGFLYVADFSGQVLRYEANTGRFDRVFASSADLQGSADGIAFGPNGNLFVCVTGQNPAVLQFDPTTGQLIGPFTQGTSLTMSRSLDFGPDGNLYLTDLNGNDTRVARFNGATGQYIDDYITTDQGASSSRHLGFGPDSLLYISSTFPGPYDGIYVFDGTMLNVFVDGNDGSNLAFPTYFVWSP